MDRQIIYPGAIPLETDLLKTNKNSLIGLSKLAAAVLGTGTFLNGLACAATSPASLQVNVAPGEIYSLQNIDGTAYSSVAADTTHSILKQGILLDQATLNCPAPVASGQSINYLIQVAYQDVDAEAVALPYYNASNPAQAYSGPNNSGVAQNTVRKGVCAVSVKAGVSATTGTQLTPAPDSGYIGAWVVTVAYGQTQITSGNISVYGSAPFLPTAGLVVGAIQGSSCNTSAAGGTADAITGTYTPAVAALISGMTLYVRAAQANATTTPTFTPNSGNIAAKAIVKGNGVALVAGDIAGAGYWMELQYDLAMDSWVLQNPATGLNVGVTQPTGDSSTKLATTAFVQGRNPANITNLLFPSMDGGWRDINRAGWLPWWANQQWGGAQVGHEIQDAATGTTYKFEPATGQVQDDAASNISDVAGVYYVTNGFKVSEAGTFDASWEKLYKVGNPTGNITFRIYSDNAGSPNAALGSAVTLSAKVLSSKTDGAWYRTAGFNVALTAGTQYHLVATMSGLDASNYVVWKRTNSNKYPHGYCNSGTSAPVWTPFTGISHCFMIEPPASLKWLQPGGQFDAKLLFAQGSPVDQSKLLAQPLRNFYDGRNFTYLIRGTWPASSTIADFNIGGLDHDRICIYTDGSGHLKTTLWRQDGTPYTVTGTTDVSSGLHGGAIVVRTVGDGADYLKLYVDGASEGAPLTAQTFTMDPLMRDLGTAVVGGGHAATVPSAAAGSLSSFAALPSGSGWTWSGGTEANCMSVVGGKLYQNKNGFGATDSGNYTKAAAGFSNATGWTAEWKVKVPSNTNAANGQAVTMRVYDGTKFIDVVIQEYFLTTNVASGGTQVVIQGDFKSQEHVFLLHGKGSDYWLEIDGKLAIDGVGGLTAATASNQIVFGDQHLVSGENADAVWSCVKFYTGGMLLPAAANGGSLSEAVYWSGDQSAILPALYNAGTPISVKKFCGMWRNYIGDGVVQKVTVRGVTDSPTTTSVTPVLLADMEAFVIGSDIRVDATNPASNSGAALHYLMCGVDGEGGPIGYQYSPGASSYTQNVAAMPKRAPLGLHKVDARWFVASGTGLSYSRHRQTTIEARS